MNTNTTEWREVPLPPRMKHMRRDHRGYPVPFIVLNDRLGRPMFAVNDGNKQVRCIKEKRCPICGFRLESVFWFVGGPLSAFHKDGFYNDSAMHKECMEYALRVCPYLAMRAAGHTDLKSVESRLDHLDHFVIDPTMISAMPVVFVAVSARKFRVTLRSDIGVNALRPERPYLNTEYWRNGERLPDDEGARIAEEAYKLVVEQHGL